MIRYKSDLRSLLFVLINLILIIAPFFIALNFFQTVTWVWISAVFSFCSCVITHNHMHQPIFYSANLNLFLNCLLSIGKGHTATTIVVPHNLNHHVHNGSADDWIKMENAGQGWGVFRIMRYFFKSSYTMNTRRRTLDAPKLLAKDSRNQKIERGILLAFVLICLYVDWQKTFIFVFIPWYIAIFYLISVNLFQHDGCNPNDLLQSARSFTGKPNNWWFFNNGYHTIHHLDPGLHWSLLPEAHRTRVKPYIPNELEEPSVPQFIFKNYLIKKTKVSPL